MAKLIRTAKPKAAKPPKAPKAPKAQLPERHKRTYPPKTITEPAQYVTVFCQLNNLRA